MAKGNLVDHKGALQDFNLAIKANPELSEAYQNRGTSKFQFGDKLGACLDWSKAGELGYYDAYEYILELPEKIKSLKPCWGNYI